MKLVRYGKVGEEKPGLIDENGSLWDLSAHISDLNGNSIDDATIRRLRSLDTKSLSPVAGAPRLGACVSGVGKFICIGLNYYDHALETGLPVPEHPIVFMKATSSINGPNDDVILPRGSTQSDWEIELAIIIGKKTKYVSKDEALNSVAGYCIVNDISERDFQLNLGGQWTKGKSCDTFGPVGPWLVTRDEIPNPQKLALRTSVNGVLMQEGNSADMIFPVAEIIAHLSDLMTLYPGDIVATGTPAGVGMGKKPEPIFLKDGDVITMEIELLGCQTQRVFSQ